MEEKKTPTPQQHGVLVLHKPKGLTSAACIAKIKHGFAQKKIGHAGTLDPMAEGVLLVLLGQATKISNYLMEEGEKTYSGSIRLGVTTDTWDAEGEVLETNPTKHITAKAVTQAMQDLTGEYEQEVPAYSAAKHKGKPLYVLARQGLPTPVKKKMVTIFCDMVELVNQSQVRFRVTCSSGTYIRSLAHSLGKRLKCGAMLEELMREYSYPFGIAKAHHLDTLATNASAFPSYVASISDALPNWAKVVVAHKDAVHIKNGHALLYTASTPFTVHERTLLVEEDGTPLALAETNMVDDKELWVILRGLWT